MAGNQVTANSQLVQRKRYRLIYRPGKPSYVHQRYMCQCRRFAWRRETEVLKDTMDAFPPTVGLSDDLSFRFMDLPLEVRLLVSEHHFLQPAIKIRGTESCQAGTMCPNNIYNVNVPVGTFLLASKTIYHESLPIYIRSKDFKFWNLYEMGRSLRRSGSFQRSYITNLSFCIPSINDVSLSEAQKLCQLVAHCAGLRKLSIVVHTWDHEEPEPSIDDVTGTAVFQMLYETPNFVSVSTDRKTDTATLCFDPSTKRGHAIDDNAPAWRSRSYSSQGTWQSSRTMRTDFSSKRVTWMTTPDEHDEILFSSPFFPACDNKHWLRSVIYDHIIPFYRTDAGNICQKSDATFVPIYNNWS